MIAPIWHAGNLDTMPAVGDAPLVWHVRLDDPDTAALAQHAALRPEDLRDLADRPQSAMRGLRRRLSRLLLARVARCHPDVIHIARSPAGAPTIAHPTGWHLSVAGRWPHGLIGIARAPVGVDIEPLDALPPPDDALTPVEYAALVGASDRARLCRWVAKEAHAKLFGIAAQVDPADIETWDDGDMVCARSAVGQSICHLRVMGDTVAGVAQRVF